MGVSLKIFHNDDSQYINAHFGIAIPKGYLQVNSIYGPHQDMQAHAGIGGNVTVGDIARSFGISLGGLDSFIQLGAILSLREQLVNAGFENPEKIEAKFNDISTLTITSFLI